jgi:molybdenum cofactor guanylyltransferase
MQMSFSGLVLSGGRGSRMGGADKGLVHWRGMPMAEHVCRQLSPLTCEVLLSCNRNQAQYSVFATQILGDAQSDYPGPLAGIVTGLRTMRGSHLLVLPCDLPAITSALLAGLQRLSRQYPERPVVVRQGAGLQPLVCVVPRELKEAIELAWDQGERSPNRLWQQLQAVELACAEDDPQLINVNSLDILAAA